MSVLFTFPGQGSQSPGMLSRLPADAEVERTFAQARAVLGRDPGELDTEASLRSTVAVQLALLIAGVAMARLLIARGAGPDMVAGMSVGAYPAAVVAGVLDYEDALRLVALRGRLMEEAFPAGYGMTAVIGLEPSQLERIVARIHSPSQPVFIANLNAERQIIVAGADAAMEAVADAALEQGATRCERLAVGVPSHCELLAPVAHAMKNAFTGVAAKRPHSFPQQQRRAGALGPRPHRRRSRRQRRHTGELARHRQARLGAGRPAGRRDAEPRSPHRTHACRLH